VTRGGDGGETSLGDGTRVRKDHPRIAALGAVDEANAAIGVLRLHTAGRAEIDATLAAIQNDLFDLGADLCVPGTEPTRHRLGAAPLARLEAAAARHNAGLAPLTSFVLPGGHPAAAHAHLARAIARRAERDVVALGLAEPLNPNLVRYLNRLSDLLFILARVLNDDGAADIPWRPAEPG
jgi:cob(I)alamin adenosyltransferase